jgi:hypothetical protein
LNFAAFGAAGFPVEEISEVFLELAEDFIGWTRGTERSQPNITAMNSN